MTKKFAIRKVAFHYSDDHLYFHTMGAIVGEVYSDYQEAHDSLMALEREAYTTTDLGDIEPFSACSSGVEIDRMVRLSQYFEKDLGLNILKLDEYGRISADRDSFLPKSITNEQLDRVRYLSGLKFYDIVEFPDEPQFYGIWKKEPFYRNEGFRSTEGSVYFYNSYMEAYSEATKHCPYDLNETEIKGKLEDISDMPIILQTLIKSSSAITYDADKEVLRLRNMLDKEWASLCTLLKIRPFEIKLLSFDEVKTCEQWAYECM
jgi:hypothetical protein